MAALLCASVFTLCAAGRAHAYSNFQDYVRSIDMGGGAGRLFTGSPNDGYGCDVCHRGAQGAELQILGLPTEGYVPGQSYEIAFHWPLAATDVALMAEFTDLAGGPAGITGMLPVAQWQPGEFCEDGTSPTVAADVCRAGSAADGCCIEDMNMPPDTCSFPGERSVFWVKDCRTDFARVVWTAPSVPMDVWFSTEMVTSDLQNDAIGDGTTSMRVRLQPAGASSEVSSAVGDCSIAPRVVTSRFAQSLALLVCGAVFGRMRRRGARKPGSVDIEGDHHEVV